MNEINGGAHAPNSLDYQEFMLVPHGVNNFSESLRMGTEIFHSLKSLLDQIDGIGSIRKRALLNHFGSARAVESASLDEIKSVDGVEEKVAKKIYNFFHE